MTYAVRSSPEFPLPLLKNIPPMRTWAPYCAGLRGQFVPDALRTVTSAAMLVMAFALTKNRSDCDYWMSEFWPFEPSFLLPNRVVPPAYAHTPARGQSSQAGLLATWLDQSISR